MAIIKTAISLQKPLFEELERLARQMRVSRSRLLALALEEFIRRRENQQLLEKMNQAYDDAPDDAELMRLRKMRLLHRKVVVGEW
jgi:metal-responsive CopG/Arc/MetJ family transcriptional regulator